MLARGYAGSIPKIDEEPATVRAWAVALAGPLAVAAIAGVAWGLQP
jgi:hypothetical protein